MSLVKQPLSFSAQLEVEELGVFERACAQVGLVPDDKVAGAIAREALLEWCEWLDARAQFPSPAEQRRTRAVRLFGRVSQGSLPTKERVRKAFPLLTGRQAANLIADLADAQDPVYDQRLRDQLKQTIDNSLKKLPKNASVVRIWFDNVAAPVFQDLLDAQFQAGGLKQQVKGAPAGSSVLFSAVDVSVVKAIRSQLP